MRPRLFFPVTAGSLAIAFALTLGIAAARSETATHVVVNKSGHPILLRAHVGAPSASFTLAGDAKILLGSNPNASLTDLMLGQDAHVSYTIENGLWVAHEIVVNPSPAHHAANHSNPSSTANELHAHGAILAYNADTGNLTIKYHR